MLTYGDLHCDTLWRCFEWQTDRTDPRLQIKSDPPFSHLQTYAIYIPEGQRDPYGYFCKVYAYSLKMMERFPNLVLCKNAKEIDGAFEEGKTPYLISVENGGFFGDPLREDRWIVEDLKQKGVAFLSLCYNHGNKLAGGCLCPQQGLTARGRSVAERLWEQGISLDLSHLNHRSADQLLELLPNGVVATHSNCYSLMPHPRNLTDDQLDALVEKQGLVGINFYPPFLCEGEAGIQDIFRHIRYVERRGGRSVLAFGSDFDGIDQTPAGLEDLCQITALSSLPPEYLYGNMKNYLDRHFQ